MKFSVLRAEAKAANAKQVAAKKTAEDRCAKAPKRRREPVPLTGKKGAHKKRAALGYCIDD